MHEERTIREGRIERDLSQRLRPRIHVVSSPLTVEAWHVSGEPVPFEDAAIQTFEPFAVGAPWGRAWATTWFRMSGEIPADWIGSGLELVIDLGFESDPPGFQAEGLVWKDGKPFQGIHPRRQSVPLPDAQPGSFSVLVEAAANPLVHGRYEPTSLGSLHTAGDALLYRLARADLAIRDEQVDQLCLEVDVLSGVMRGLALHDPRRQRLLRQLCAAFDALDMEAVSITASDARQVLGPALELPGRASSMHVIGVGHAHIDTAWLWPTRESIRKCARTFASAIRLMDAQPTFRFACSQAAQYDWIERIYPDLFADIAVKVRSGQFIPVGGMWVEADMNLPSGESLVRQLVHGQRYFQSRFGIRCTEVWLPDVFGYPASMPQIYASAGCLRFVTQKLSWNKQNRFPHSTFLWQGLDGTRVLTHFPPVDTYNAQVTAEEMIFSEQNFREHGWSNWALMPYGYGNGGGGPTHDMVKRALSMRDLDGVPRLQLGTCAEFFDHVDEEIANGAPIPVWDGELYFETHRGTLTSQIETKVGNRRCERLLREAELWWAAGGRVPDDVAAELSALWNDVLLQQFHDILPGSSIAWVHRDAEAVHHRVTARLTELIDGALCRLGLTGNNVANAATHRRREAVVSTTQPHGSGPIQYLADGAQVCVIEVPGCGVAPLEAQPTDDLVVVSEQSMANGQLEFSWDHLGTITSIVHTATGREVLSSGRPITVELAPDLPVEYDAWDLESWTTSRGVPIASAGSVEVTACGPLLGQIRVRHSFGSSSLTMTCSLRAESPRLDISLDIDWHESEKLLTLMVPMAVQVREATCDIQFGHVRRPTHTSSSWDAAKFEVCAHRFVDLSEPAFGVAVLNDGRYGHRLFDGGVRVSLLRGPLFPDPGADKGHHHVNVCVLPHGPGLHEVLHEAEALNLPLRIAPGAGEAGTCPSPVVTIDHPGVQLSAVKRADDSTGDLILRLHEACGDHVAVELQTAQPIVTAFRCNALEENLEPLPVEKGAVRARLGPFQLLTVRLGSAI